MWERSELKAAARETLQRTYWASVLVSLIMMIVGGNGGIKLSYNVNVPIGQNPSIHATGQDLNNANQYIQDSIADRDDIDMDDIDDIEDLPPEVKNALARESDTPEADRAAYMASFMAFMAVFAVVFVIVMIVSIVLATFVFMPLLVGCERYFIRAGSDEGKIDDVVFAFKDNYKNVVWVMFVRLMKILGWSLLLIIPGIIKSYEYRMIPYLLAEDPSMSCDEAFATTRKMMDGNKWDTFVLELSFIGWVILGVLTCGLGLVFWVNPYINLTNAELYLTLKAQNFISFDDTNKFDDTFNNNNNDFATL